MRYCIYYLYDVGVFDRVCQYLPYLRGMIFYRPSECCMMIPGTYAEMHEDYD